MRRRWATSIRRERRSTGTWVTGLVVAIGAAAFVVSALPSTRRYMRLRTM